MWTLPTLTDLNQFWEVIKETDLFLVQKQKQAEGSVWKNVVSTFQNVFDTRQPPFRILIKSHNNVERGHLVAVADTQKAIEKDWEWIQENLSAELNELEEVWDKEVYAVSKFQSMVQGQDTYTDEKSNDAKFRAASRAWRQTFQTPESERLVSFYACAYGTSTNQGWMYISLSIIYFYSFVFGQETKVSIEMKDIEEIKKAFSKRGLVADAIRISTKDQKEHLMSNFFHRDDTYDLLQHLTNLCMTKLLQNTSSEPAPGLALGAGNPRSPTAHSSNETLFNPQDSTQSRGAPTSTQIQQLKQTFEQQQRNTKYQSLFSLPTQESLAAEIRCVMTLSNSNQSFHGTLYLSQTFLCFTSSARYACHFALPFFAIKRVEKVNAMSSALAVIVWHQLPLMFQLLADSKKCEAFLGVFKDKIQISVGLMKSLKDFLQSCPSEALIKGEEPPGVGLGPKYGYLETRKEKSKMNYWLNYFKEFGRNLTLIRLPTFIKLVRVGLPNSIRGEIWELSSGAMYRRYMSEGYYARLHEEHAGTTSLSTEEIEKDLNRSLPDYSGYQTPEGINSLRRVLYAFSFHDPEIGYCQAMNLIVSALLIFLSEEQAFHILTVLSERLLPGYYSVNMVGAVLDIQVFEALVCKYMPMLTDQFKKHEIQLSVASLPWFLSLYINTLPLVYGLRVVDCFFLEGPKVLFQVGLAILKVNGEALLAARDDGELMAILRGYFASLGQLIAPENDPTAAPTRQITKFNLLMLTAYREFQSVTHELIMELRRAHQPRVVQGLDVYAKRSIIRNLVDTHKFSREQLLFLCDQFYTVQFYGGTASDSKAAADDKPASDKKKADRMALPAFQAFLGRITTWGDLTQDVEMAKKREGTVTLSKPVPGSQLIAKLFQFMDKNHAGEIDFQSIVSGLGRFIFTDMMSRLNLFFRLHDGNNDEVLTRDEILVLSESLLFLFRKDELGGDKSLSSVSNILQKALPKADNGNAPSPTDPAPADTPPPPGLSVTTWREYILADEFLLEYFDQSFPKTFIFSLAEQRASSVTLPTTATPALLSNNQKLGNMIMGGLKNFSNSVKIKASTTTLGLRRPSNIVGVAAPHAVTMAAADKTPSKGPPVARPAGGAGYGGLRQDDPDDEEGPLMSSSAGGLSKPALAPVGDQDDEDDEEEGFGEEEMKGMEFGLASKENSIESNKDLPKPPLDDGAPAGGAEARLAALPPSLGRAAIANPFGSPATPNYATAPGSRAAPATARNHGL